MPFILILIGAFFLIAGARDTQGTLYTLMEKDFTGTNNFFYWFLSIMVIGGIGYIKPLRPISHGFLTLVLLGLFLSGGRNQNFFSQFQSQIEQFAAIQPTPIGIASSAGDVTAEPTAPPAASSGASGILGSLITAGLGFLGI
jgi:hypothetical protein